MTERERILALVDLPGERVPVPEWGCDVWVRHMTGEDRDALEAAVTGAAGLRNFRARVVVAVATDEAGGKIFEPADIEALGRTSSVALERIFKVACRMNGIGPAVVEDAKND